MQTAPSGDAAVLAREAEPKAADCVMALATQLSKAGSMEEVMALVSHGVRELLHADGATFVLRDRDRCYYAEEDAVSPLWKGRRFPIGQCISGWSMNHRAVVAIADIYKDGRIPADAYRPTFVRSLAMAPVGREAPVAALGAYWAQHREPNTEELERLQAIADAAAQAIATFRSEAAASEPAPARAQAGMAPPAAPRGAGGVRAFVRRLRREGLRANTFEAYAFAALCVLAATVAREAVRATGVQGLAIFSTYYPAVLLSMLVGGRRAGVTAAVLGGLAAYWFFMPPLYEFTRLTVADALNLAVYAGASGMIILTIDWYQRAVLRLRAEDAEHQTLAREQRHRVKNALQVVQTIVKQSLRDDPERAGIINQRVRSALTDVQMGEGKAETAASLRDLLVAELQPYDLSRFSLAGPDSLALSPRPRRLLTLAAHELATNAAKYGALSEPEGQVAVSWKAREGWVSMTWTESGGPPVAPPQRRGFGLTMLHRLSAAAGGALNIDYRPSGVRAELSLPLPV
jgi:two-component sensor histidine kinase/GAF domain-containing protein